MFLYLSGTDDDLKTTTTVITMHRLAKGDQIYTKIDHESDDHGKSMLFSTNARPSIHFVGQKISD